MRNHLCVTTYAWPNEDVLVFCTGVQRLALWNNFGSQSSSVECDAECLANPACGAVVFRPGTGACTGYIDCNTRDLAWSNAGDQVRPCTWTLSLI